MVIQYNNFLMKKSSLSPKTFFSFNQEELQYLTCQKSFMSGLPVCFCGPVYCDILFFSEAGLPQICSRKGGIGLWKDPQGPT